MGFKKKKKFLALKIQTTTIYQYLNCTPFTPFSDRVFKIESDTCFPKGKPYNVLTIKIYTRKVSLKYVSLQIQSVMSINLSSIQCSIYTVHRAWGTGVWESNLESLPPREKREIKQYCSHFDRADLGFSARTPGIFNDNTASVFTPMTFVSLALVIVVTSAAVIFTAG